MKTTIVCLAAGSDQPFRLADTLAPSAGQICAIALTRKTQTVHKWDAIEPICHFSIALIEIICYNIPQGL